MNDELESSVEKLADILTNRRGPHKILEYDLQPILDAPNELFRIEQDQYLLVNKLVLKNLYFKWRAEFLEVNNRNCRSVEKLVQQARSDHIDKLAKLILVVNPNFLSAWSYCKQLFVELFQNSEESDFSSIFTAELDFNALVLIKHFKCEQAYVHRRWLLRTCHSTLVTQELILAELKLIVNCLSRKIKSNYYCWTYFNWLLTLLDSRTLLDRVYSDLFVSDVLFTNPSDFCVFHSRLQLMRAILADKKSSSSQQLTRAQIERVVVDELALIDDILLRNAIYSTTWNYSKYFLLFLEDQLCSNILTIDSFGELDLELNNRFLTNFKSFRPNASMIDDSVLLETKLKANLTNFLECLVERQIKIVHFISIIYESDENFEKIKHLQNKYVSFVEKFLGSKKSDTTSNIKSL